MFYIKKFNTLWYSNEYTVSYKIEILDMLKGVFREDSPEFLYYFTLNELFGDRLDSRVERFESDNLKIAKYGICFIIFKRCRFICNSKT